MPTEKKMTGYPSIDKPWVKYYSEDVIKVTMPECSIYEYLWESNKEHLEEFALNYFDRKITYGELFEEIDKAAKAFSALGVKEGDIVTFAALSCPETVFSLYALNKIGAIPNMVNVLSSAEDFKRYINEVDSKVFVCWNVFYNTATEKLSETSAKSVVVIEPSNYLPSIKKMLFKLRKSPKINYSSTVLNWNDFIKQGDPIQLTDVCVSADSTCVIAHTGGTTGEPKGVLLSNKAINAVALQFDKASEHYRQEVYMDLIVPFVIYGIGVNLHMPLCLGMTVVLIPFFKPEEVPGFFLHYKPNLVISIPSYWSPLLTSKKAQKADFSFLRIAGAGGDGLTVELQHQLDKFLSSHGSKALIHNGYGMTEVCASAICAWDYAVREGSIGIPMPYNNVKIVEPETDKELGYGEIGEVCIASPSVMLGYYKNEEATNDLIRMHSDNSKWVHSGDLGYIDEDGFVFLTGRIRRIILTSYTEIPSKIFPDQIEKVILKHPAVFQCCVVSDPHPKYKFVTKAHIVLKDGFSNQDEVKTQIEELCKNNLPDYSIPFSYCFRNELPLTAVGKVDWRKLEEEATALRNDK